MILAWDFVFGPKYQLFNYTMKFSLRFDSIVVFGSQEIIRERKKNARKDLL